GGLKSQLQSRLTTLLLEGEEGGVVGVGLPEGEKADGAEGEAGTPRGNVSKVSGVNADRVDGDDDGEGDGEVELQHQEAGMELDIEGMTVSELREQLHERGYAVAGRKADLQQRLRDVLVTVPAAATATEATPPGSDADEPDADEAAAEHEAPPAAAIGGARRASRALMGFIFGSSQPADADAGPGEMSEDEQEPHPASPTAASDASRSVNEDAMA
ncbi:unnamed protein product, partial [Chrysoparadoxa australica]